MLDKVNSLNSNHSEGSVQVSVDFIRVKSYENDQSSGEINIIGLDKLDNLTGKNVLMITVKDKDGNPVEKATVTVDPQMPSMGHGSSETAKVEELGQGKYKASPVTFQMGGEWEVTVNAKKGDDTGRKTFKYNVK